jgi:hypothetical protein
VGITIALVNTISFLRTAQDSRRYICTLLQEVRMRSIIRIRKIRGYREEPTDHAPRRGIQKPRGFRSAMGVCRITGAGCDGCLQDSRSWMRWVSAG